MGIVADGSVLRDLLPRRLLYVAVWAADLRSHHMGLFLGLLEGPHDMEVVLPRKSDQRERARRKHNAFYYLVFRQSIPSAIFYLLESNH